MARRVVNVQNLDLIFLNAIRDNVWQGRKYQFSSAIFAAAPSALRHFFQGTDAVVQLCYGGVNEIRMILNQKIVYRLQVVGCGPRPSYPHYRCNIRLTRAFISSSSMNSPRSACSIPARTPARNDASSSNRRSAASFTSSWGLTPSRVAIDASRASCSGVK